MALDASDLVESFLDDQARVNSALDDGDPNNLVTDTAQVTGEKVGMQTETISTATTSPPNTYDGAATWGFVSWG